MEYILVFMEYILVFLVGIGILLKYVFCFILIIGSVYYLTIIFFYFLMIIFYTIILPIFLGAKSNILFFVFLIEDLTTLVINFLKRQMR